MYVVQILIARISDVLFLFVYKKISDKKSKYSQDKTVCLASVCRLWLIILKNHIPGHRVTSWATLVLCMSIFFFSFLATRNSQKLPTERISTKFCTHMYRGPSCRWSHIKSINFKSANLEENLKNLKSLIACTVHPKLMTRVSICHIMFVNNNKALYIKIRKLEQKICQLFLVQF